MAATELAHTVTELDPAAERARERDFAALAERPERDGRGADELVATVHSSPAPQGGAPTHL